MNETKTNAPSTMPIHFKGKGDEYFRIWIVNLALSIITLGIYSPWAKVRRNRYFYGTTFLQGHNFDYTANPVKILKGRAIALAFFIALSVSEVIPLLYGVLFILFLIAVPWAVRQTLRFRHRYTEYRNLRFRFTGGLKDSWMITYLWPLVGVVSLGTLWPLSKYMSKKYMIDNANYGNQSLFLIATIKGMYWVTFKTFMFGLLLYIAVYGALAALWIPIIKENIGDTVPNISESILESIGEGVEEGLEELEQEFEQSLEDMERTEDNAVEYDELEAALENLRKVTSEFSDSNLSSVRSSAFYTLSPAIHEALDNYYSMYSGVPPEKLTISAMTGNLSVQIEENASLAIQKLEQRMLEQGANRESLAQSDRLAEYINRFVIQALVEQVDNQEIYDVPPELASELATLLDQAIGEYAQSRAASWKLGESVADYAYDDFDIELDDAQASSDNEIDFDFDEKFDVSSIPVWLWVLTPLLFLCSVFVRGASRAWLLNYLANGTKIGEQHYLSGKLHPVKYGWVLFSNALLTIITLGVYWPWAVVRQRGYVLNNVALIGPSDLDHVVADASEDVEALGEEFDGMFDLDIGL